MSYKQLATDLMFSAVNGNDIERKYGLALRKGKTVADIGHARHKATRSGRNKVEFELSMLEVYLKQVLKSAPKVKA